VDLDIRDFGIADSALVILDPGVNLSIVLQHLGQGVEPERAVRALIVFLIFDVTLQVPFHPARLACPEGAAKLLAVDPTVVGVRKVEASFAGRKLFKVNVLLIVVLIFLQINVIVLII